MKLIHLSDTHLLARRGETLYGLDPHARLAEAIDSVVRRHADAEACLVTGDLTDAGSDAACRDLAGLLARLPMPVHLLPGNHDDRAALLRHFPSMQRDAGGFLQGAVELSLGRLLLLDSVDAGRPQGCYCAARLDWLDGQLRRAERDDVPLWLALHHPPMDSGIVSMDRYGMPGERPRALAELLRPHAARIRHLFFGHVHRAFAGTWQGIGFSCTRSTCHQVALDLTREDEVPGSDEPAGYGVILADARQVIVHHQLIGPMEARFVL